jgi:hypothetical protein
MMWFVFTALQQMGFRFSPEILKFLIAKRDVPTHKQMSVDQFVVVCVQIQKFTGEHCIKYVDCSFNRGISGTRSTKISLHSHYIMI